MRISRPRRGAGGEPAGWTDRTSVRRTTAWRRTAGRRTGSTPPAVARRTRRPPGRPAADGAHGCVRRRDRGRAPARRPHAGVWTYPEDPEERCTTGLRPERAARWRRGARTRCALGCARSSRQAVTALGAAGLQHGPTGAGAHPGAEAVLLGTATVVGLVGALHAALLEPPRGRPILTCRKLVVARRNNDQLRRTSRQDYGQRPEVATARRTTRRAGARPTAAGDTANERRSEGVCAPASVRPSRVCVVHIVWTTLWTLRGGPKGDAGERP